MKKSDIVEGLIDKVEYYERKKNIISLRGN